MRDSNRSVAVMRREALQRCVGARREGNKWSHHYCRRQWSLVDAEHLRYRQLSAWDAALQRLEQARAFLSSSHQIVSYAGEDEQARASADLLC